MQPGVNLTSEITGYHAIEQLYCGSRTLVYRAIREADMQPVVIKILRRDYPTFNELLQFRNQYTIAKNLRLTGVIEPYSLEFYRHSYALVMEDFGGISLKEYVQTYDIDLNEFLTIASQLSEILNGLYCNRVIHKDIKSANILIHPETKQVKLIDFSIASLLPRETQEIQNPNVLEGTLAYISPEQTGRMNRGIDYRTDFYSLGVTFYELLTKQLPFECDDPMELVHCHIAKQPDKFKIQNSKFKDGSAIPQVITDIAIKLMAKNAEDRYQSALGLQYDLEKCWQQWQATGSMETFKLGQRDLSDRFLIPEKLYGREREVGQLLAAFERVAQGNSEMMLVAGFSGIGKTVVVNEVHKPIVRQHGYFIKGKFDQFNRNIPFSGFVQAFRDLMGQLLSESDDRLQQWRTKILSALGDNAQVIMEVIPELERIIGVQPPVAELSGNAAQNRFHLLFEKFIAVFTTQEHPLVIFLDDLQWADLASLKLIQLLMSNSETGYLLAIGAYRDNEVSATHPLILTLEEIQKTGVNCTTITLAPLQLFDINQLIADTLSCSQKLALPLTKLVYQKTKGNPFFNHQFLKSLYAEKLIDFDFEVGYWQCDITQIKALALTDDVVEFMTAQLQKLPKATQEVLKLAACIGNQFDLGTLGIVYQKSQDETATDLWKALQEGLVLPTSEAYKFFAEDVGIEADALRQSNFQLPTYRFLHDRVQQAAYCLIPDDRKQATHLQIGQLLLHDSSEVESEEKLFDLVGHLNLGKQLITQPNEREILARLNLKAGNKARNSTAYLAASVYLQTGIELLQTDCWQTQYELTLNLYVAAAEVSYLNADFEGMEKRAALVLQNAQTICDRIKIYAIQIVAQTGQCQMLEAISTGREVLKQLGVDLPIEPDETKIDRALQNLDRQLQGREIEELIDLPIMSDRQTQAAMELLGMVFSPTFLGMPGLLPLLSATMVSLSLQFGNAPPSTAGYGIHGMVLCAFFGEVEKGYSFGRLALNLLDRFNAQAFKPLILHLYGIFIQHRKEALQAVRSTLKEGYIAGMEAGSFLYGSYNIVAYFFATFASGIELDSWEPELATYSAALAQAKQDSARIYVSLTWQIVQNLRGNGNQPDCLNGSIYDETAMIPKHHRDSELTAIAVVYIYKLLLACSFENYTAALNYITQAQPYLMAVGGCVHVPIFHFYAALTHLALFSTQPELKQTEILAVVETHQTTLQQWAQYAPMNHLHKWHLVEAERQKVLGNKTEAIEHYDRAIAVAKENGNLPEEALANELAAKFYLEWGKEKVAAGYLQESYYGYARWGAKAKTDDLEKRYPQLLQPILQQRRLSINPLESIGNLTFSGNAATACIYSSSSGSSISNALDFASVLKAAQAISSSIELDELMASLTRILLENSGAKKSVLILLQNGNWQVKAITSTHHHANSEDIQTVLDSQSLETCQDVPQQIIQYVKNTQKTVIIDRLTTDIPGLIGDYLLTHKPQSLCCTPIVERGNSIGIVYLENQLTSGVFTSERCQIIHLLASQAAISLENARLYQQAQQALADLQQAQLQIVQSEKMSAIGNLVAGVAHEINNPVGFISGNITEAIAAVEDITSYLQFYREQLPNLSAEIAAKAPEIEIEYLLEDLPKMLDSMQVGCERIKDISTSLRTFSRADKDYKVPFDIHQGIDSTLLILKHRLKANKQRPAIEVVKDYGSLPPIDCFPGQLNQVFMNILANAIDALEEFNGKLSDEQIKSHVHCIAVQTEMRSEDWVNIRIKDNGLGMPEEIKTKIFDRLFTTKGVGKGTGLGLAIAKSIVVEKHGGAIEVNSVLGQGTEFVISLPLKS